ncbi:MAG: hypothetical protein ABIP68_03230, partial [Ferruginibacter sp.]
MQFIDVIGQKEIKSQLIKMVSENRLSHALLFLEKEGAGGLALARAFAQYIVCEKANPVKSKVAGGSLFGEAEPEINEAQIISDSCGVCAACKKAAAMIHPDIHFSFPVIPTKATTPPLSSDYITEWRQYISKNPYSNLYNWLQFIKAENKQGNITAKECEEILRKLSLKSFESEYKILIMWMPEALGNEGNKLLKLIEEPPANTLFIFVAKSEELILQTILSRTQLVKIPPLQHDDIKLALEERANLSPEKAQEIANISSGNYLEAVQLVQHSSEDWLELLKSWLNSIIKTGNIAQVKMVDELAKLGREKQKQFLNYFNHLIEHSIRLRTIGEELGSKSASINSNDFALKLNKFTSISQQEAIVLEIDKATYHITRNANAKLLFHA